MFSAGATYECRMAYQHGAGTILHTRTTILCLQTKDTHYFVLSTASERFPGQCIQFLSRTILQSTLQV